MSSIGEKIKVIRQKFNLTQTQFADEVGVSRQIVTKWEADMGLPDTEHVQKIARLFGVTTDFLLNNRANMPLLAMRKAINSDEIQAEKGYTKKDSAVRSWFDESYQIFPLARKKKMSFVESIFDIFVLTPGSLELADLLAERDRYYYVTRGDVQFLVQVSNAEIIVKELAERPQNKKISIEQNDFKIFKEMK